MLRPQDQADPAPGSEEGEWFGSDRVVETLVDLGVDAIAINPGATLRGLHDSLLHFGDAAPRLVPCLHEEIAVAFAHGYARATGRAMVAALHDTVGLLHASMAIFNAWVDRVPMLVLVGTGPLDATKRRPWIDWVHTVSDPGELVRPFTVWNDQPTSLPALMTSLRRGWRAAATVPGGPAVVSIDVDLQEMRCGRERETPLPGRGGSSSRIAPDDDSVRSVIGLLRSSRRPTFVTDRQLSEQGGGLLLELAGRCGAAIVDFGVGNVPVGHELDVTSAGAEILGVTDLLMFIDTRDPAWILSRGESPPVEAPSALPPVPIVQIGTGTLGHQPSLVQRGEVANELVLLGDPELVLQRLLDSWGSDRRSLDPSMRRTAKGLEQRSTRSRQAICQGSLAHAVAKAARGYDYLIANGSLRGWTRAAFRPASPRHFLGITEGAGLGYGLPAAIGAAYGMRESGRLVIDLQGDGDLAYVPQALWTLAHLEVGLLIVVDTNRQYAQDANHQRSIAASRGRIVRATMEGIDLVDPPIKVADLARSLGVEAEGPIDNVRDLSAALDRGVAAASTGRPYLLEVETVA